MTQRFDDANRLRPSRCTEADASIPARPLLERRRVPRWSAHVPLFIYGHGADETPFHEDTFSAVVSDHGALLFMTTPVTLGQKLLIINKMTQDERECRVASIGRPDGSGVEVGVEFVASAPDFWAPTVAPRYSTERLPIGDRAVGGRGSAGSHRFPH